MSPRGLATLGSAFALGFLVLGSLAPPARGQQPHTLELFPTENVRVIAKMDPERESFTNYIFWNPPFWDSPAADRSFFVHPPDTVGWRRGTPLNELSLPSAGGRYRGRIDRTVQFGAATAGRVGSGTIRLRCEVMGGREDLEGYIDIGQGYTPGTPIPVRFSPGNVDLGFTVSFAPGLVDSLGTFKVGLETYEGYHVFRGLCPVCGGESDMVNIGEVSRENAFRGALFDALYFDALLPALRTFGVYTLPAPPSPISGFGGVIDIRGIHPNGRLGPDELIWVDRNAFNGFTYHYLVTTFDKGYGVSSFAQGIRKYDSCTVTQAQNCPCPEHLVSVSTRLDPLWDLPRIYAVPNPYRSGSSQNTRENYHNFPDNKMRFVNVPAWCKLKIYTPSGDLVWEYEQLEGTGVVEWDTHNRSGESVASGIYIYRVEARSGNWMYGRIVIIR